jgi:hypothetical protein
MPPAWGSPNNRRRAIKKIRAMAMALEKIYGATNQSISKHFGVLPTQVTDTLKWAEKEGLLDDLYSQVEALQKQVIKELAPRVIKVYGKALDEAEKTGDVSAAKDILKGFWNARALTESRGQKPEDNDIEAFFIRRRTKGNIDSKKPPTLGDSEAGVRRLTEGAAAIDAEVVEQSREPATVADGADAPADAASGPTVR